MMMSPSIIIREQKSFLKLLNILSLYVKIYLNFRNFEKLNNNFCFAFTFKEDYRETLIEVDEKEWFHLKLVIRELRNHYNTLHSLMTKNWEKLTCPRQSNSNSMF